MVKSPFPIVPELTETSCHHRGGTPESQWPVGDCTFLRILSKVKDVLLAVNHCWREREREVRDRKIELETFEDGERETCGDGERMKEREREVRIERERERERGREGEGGS